MDPVIALGAISLSSIFVMAILYSSAQKILAHRIFVWLGFISYPLYLLHENMMVGLTIKFAKLYPAIHPLLTWGMVMALICFIAFLVARVLEVKVRNFLIHRAPLKI